MHILLPVLLLLGTWPACKIQQENTTAGKFAARQTDAIRGEANRLINHVHESEWTIAYDFGGNCTGHKLPEGKVFEDAISRVLQLWLAPVKEVAKNKSIAATFNYLKLKEPPSINIVDHASTLKERKKIFTENNVKFHVMFDCDLGNSYVLGEKFQLPFVRLSYEDDQHAETIKETYFNFSTLLHEMGHVFGLLDTYPPDDAGQPASIMSSDLEGTVLGQDDIKGIQWLYLYTYERDRLPKENLCFFADYEPSKWKDGVCLPKHPLITLLKQAEKHEMLGNNKAARNMLKKARWAINKGDMVDINKINAQDEDGNTALHLTVSYYLISNKKHPHRPSNWLPDQYLPDIWANVGITLLHNYLHCSDTSRYDGERLTQEERQQVLKVLQDDCVQNKRSYCVCIDPQITNKAGKTARDLAIEAKANDIVRAIDAVTHQSYSAGYR